MPTYEASGEIDVATAPALRTALYEMVDTHPGETVTVDLGGVEFIDSTGIGILVTVLKHARSSGGDLKLVGVNDRIAKILKITGLETVFSL